MVKGASWNARESQALIMAPDDPSCSPMADVLAAPANKRYRPSPAKTFQCRGYGECRMVFSRSEHLARHIRKHTGERPFTCHCSKQFSRLDNLRQHAQTVHADKQDDNERMMRQLTSLHASMSAANKLSVVRTPSRKVLVKQEDIAAHRPDTSTGEAMYPPNNSSFRDQNHSFRDEQQDQSFLAPDQSFLAYPQVSDAPQQQRTPPSAHPRSLPPLSAVVSASLSASQQQHSPSQQQQQQQQQLHQHSLLSFPSSHNNLSRRPGTAPAAASFFARASLPDRSRLGSSSGRTDLSLLHSGLAGRSFSYHQQQQHQFNLAESPEFPSGNDASPFYFNPPGTSPVPLNSIPRKRPFAAPDGPSDDSTQLRSDRPSSSAGPFGELNYDYGSESRPQSRRLTLMELCNDDDREPPRPPSQRLEQSSLLLSSTTSPNPTTASRPTTSSALVSSTSTLRIFDRGTSPPTSQPSAVFARTLHAATSTVGDGSTPPNRGPPGGSSSDDPAATAAASSYFRIPSTGSASAVSPSTTTSPTLLSPTSSESPDATATQRQQYLEQQQSSQYVAHSPTFSPPSHVSNESYSPRSPLSDNSDSPFPSYTHSSTRSNSSSTSTYNNVTTHHISLASSSSQHTSSGIPTQSHHLHHHRLQHQQQHQQHHLHHHHHQRDAQTVRASVSPHTASFGMRV